MISTGFRERHNSSNTFLARDLNFEKSNGQLFIPLLPEMYE